MTRVLRAPFPWFGGKSRAASLIWRAFGNVPNYVEPFAGSLAVLLARPHTPKVETANDKDGLISNFWRAVQAKPDEVAHWADWPVNEADLHARHQWLVEQAPALFERLVADPEYSDAKIAGWWVWGVSQWIGSGWCSRPEWRGRTNGARRGRRVHAARQLPSLSGDSGATGRGVHASGRSQGDVYAWMGRLSERLRHVRICCGDWSRIVGPACTTAIGMTAILLDPPYADTAGRDRQLYAHDSLTVAHEVRAWALAHGDDAKLRIALCGYEGEHEMPPTWRCEAWKAHGGYGATRRDGLNANAARERIWFSPHCLEVDAHRDLFAMEHSA